MTAYIRAGDYIEDANLATGRLMITGFQYDVDSAVATLTIGDNPKDFVARLPNPGSGPANFPPGFNPGGRRL